MLYLTPMEQTNQTTNKKEILSKKQKHFIGSVFSGTGIVFFVLSIMLLIAVLLLIGFKFSVLLTLIGNGEVLTSLMLGLLTTGIVSFAIGTVLQEK
jgi:hypothetical protein